MILEIAEITVKPGTETQFVKAHTATVEEGEGMLSVRVTQGVENPATFFLLVEWTSLEAHERYRETEAYARWRAAIGPYAAGPATVQHVQVVA